MSKKTKSPRLTKPNNPPIRAYSAAEPTPSMTHLSHPANNPTTKPYTDRPGAMDFYNLPSLVNGKRHYPKGSPENE